MGLYSYPGSNAVRAEAALLPSTPEDEAAATKRIAAQPAAVWFSDPSLSQDELAERVTKEAEERGELPVLVIYGIPDRDCGLYSKGGARNSGEYLAWVGDIVDGIGDRPALVIVEPDAILHTMDGCIAAEDVPDQLALIQKAVQRFTGARTQVFLDAGNADWGTDMTKVASYLRDAGVQSADGVSLNVSNYVSTQETVAYGRALGRLTGVPNFVVDVSRNGAQTGDEWCNNPDARLGRNPTLDTGESDIVGYLWVKQPGNSDGECGRGEPAAGQWWGAYATRLASD
jgi:endoglucanase